MKVSKVELQPIEFAVRCYVETQNPEILKILEEEKDRRGVVSDIALLVLEVLKDAEPQMLTAIYGSRNEGYFILVSSTEGLRQKVSHAISHIPEQSYVRKLPRLLRHANDFLAADIKLDWACYDDNKGIPLCRSPFPPSEFNVEI